MKRVMMHAKIHRAVITDANPDYEGSITLDPDYLEAVGILPFEQVHVLDVDNGARFETYAIPGERGSGEVVVNGAAARLVAKGDLAIVIAYAPMEEAEAVQLEPKILHVDGRNARVAAR
ncbi:MAG: aspartate 1-decarboxylase [Actinomycetota bacterium]